MRLCNSRTSGALPNERGGHNRCMRGRQLRVALSAFALLTVSACGGGDSGDSQSETSSDSVTSVEEVSAAADTGDDSASETSVADDDVAAFIAAGTASLLDDSSFAGDEGQAECFATRLVEIVGIDKLEEGGITPDDFMAGSLDNVVMSDSQADELASLLLDDECIPFVEIMLAETTDTASLDADQLACYSDALSSSEILREGFVASFIGEEVDEEASFALFSELLQLSDDCGLTDFSEESSGGDESDADPALLEEYSDGCADGDMDACDLLYWEADYGSDEETYAATCGGLYDGKLNGSCYMLDEISDLRSACEDGDDDACNRLYFATGPGTPDNYIGATCGGGASDSDAGRCGFDEKIAEYRAACEDGDMEACDGLYWLSSPGDENAEFGATCGGRTDGEEGGNCVYDEEIAEYRTACESGDMEACDELFFTSNAGSEEEEFGASCGGRTDDSAAGQCGADERIARYRPACESGDMDACDELYFASEFGSEEEEFGATCGGRTDGDTPGGCWLLEE